jgi:hypothetical protein
VEIAGASVIFLLRWQVMNDRCDGTLEGDDTAALAAAMQHTGGDVAHARIA